MTYEDISRVNGEIDMIDMKGKDYAMVQERVTAFRKLFPEGFIITEIISNDGTTVLMKATAGYYREDGTQAILGTGLAQEVRGKGLVNSTSHIENCETSAVGRALGFLGIGIDTSIASAEEVDTAIRNQGGLPANMQKTLAKVAEAHGYTETDICGHFGVKAYKDLSIPQFKKLMDSMGENG